MNNPAASYEVSTDMCFQLYAASSGELDPVEIKDADFASENASLTRSHIMQQAALAVTAQANSSPQMLLTLLR